MLKQFKTFGAVCMEFMYFICKKDVNFEGLVL